MILQFIANGICAGALYGLVALGFSIIYSTAKVFHIAHGAVYTSAAYLFYFLYVSCKINIFVSLLISFIFAAVFGMLIDKFFYLPLSKRKSQGLAEMLTSLGIYIFVVNTIALLFGNETKVLNPGVEKTFEFGNVILTRIQILQVLSFIVLFLLTLIFLKFTKYGRLIYAVSDNTELAEALGFDIKKVRIVAAGYGSFLAASASCLSALDIGIDPHIGIHAVLKAAVAMIIGGVGAFPAAAIGGLLLGVIESLVVWQISARWQSAVSFVILILILLTRPYGLLSRKRRVEEI